MRGQILGVNRDKMEILVKHEEIPGLMAAMTMPWKVQTASMLDNLGPGDLITSEIEVDNNQGVDHEDHQARHGEARHARRRPRRRSRASSYLTPGDRSAQPGVRRSGRARARLQRHSRQTGAIAITFIYTKCPIPTFCPAMDRQFAEAQALIKDEGPRGQGRACCR